MEKIKIGTKVAPLGINRLVCADNVKSRAILLDPDPRIKYIAYDQDKKRKVEVNQELVIKYGLRPYTAIFYLVARLNTDMRGEVVGDQVTIEYLQLSENLNNEFSDLVMEMGNFNSLAITKVTKKGPNNQDFSHLNVKPSQYEVSPELTKKINDLKSNKEAIETMWKLVDRATSITAEEYEKLQVADNVNQIASPTSQPAKQIESTPKALPASQASESFESSNDFGGDDDFGDFN